MKNIHNALSDVISAYKLNMLEYTVVANDGEDCLWVVDICNNDAPGSLLQIEVIDDNGTARCSVLQRINVGRRSMNRFMNRLISTLDDQY